MHELVQLTNRTYYLNSYTKMGLYLADKGEAFLIDSGVGDADADRVLRVLEDKHWHLNAIFNTHSHPDHIGGNGKLQKMTDCKIYCCAEELGYVTSPINSGTVMYGGYAGKHLGEKSYKVRPSVAYPIKQEIMPDGFKLEPLPGHALGMKGIMTPDGVWFLADSLERESFVKTMHISYLFHAGDYVKSLERVKQLDGEVFVPGHDVHHKNIKRLAQINIDNVYEVVELILKLCREPKCFDDLMKGIMDHYGFSLSYNFYVVMGTILRSYMAYLLDEGYVESIFSGNRLLWHTKL